MISTAGAATRTASPSAWIVTRERRKDQGGHLSVTEFKVKKELEMLADIEDVKNEMLDELGEIEKKTEQAKKGADAAEARATQIIPKVKKLDEIAKEYAGDVEKKLPHW